jgi:hypothetical protein
MKPQPKLPLHIRLVPGTLVRYTGYIEPNGQYAWGTLPRHCMGRLARIHFDQGLLKRNWGDFEPNTLRVYIVVFEDSHVANLPASVLDCEIEPVD